MSQISPSILKGLSTLVPDTINYVSLVEYENTMWFLALGRKSFYFIDYNLDRYKDPPIPYQKISAFRLCCKVKTLMQIQLKPQISSAFGVQDDPELVLDHAIFQTYGKDGILNIYNQDRKSSVDSFKCYWQIDCMIQNRIFGNFPLVEGLQVRVKQQFWNNGYNNNNENQKSLYEKHFGGFNTKKEFKYPKLFFKESENEFVFNMKGYRFFVPKKYGMDIDRESEVRDKQDRNNIVTFQVKDPFPIDFLDKMQDKEKDLRLLCDQIADDFLKNNEFKGRNPFFNHRERMLISSKPYLRKNNLVADKSHNYCWEMHLRFDEFDLYISILRRSYIPPMMDMFQDIIVCSRLPFDLSNFKIETPDRPIMIMEANNNSFNHLTSIHRKIVDSIHQIDIGSQNTFYKVIIEQRADALLFSEDTINFYQYNLQIMPKSCLVYAISYLMQLMNTLLNYEQKYYKELSKLIYNTATKVYGIDKKEIISDKKCNEIVKMMEKICLHKTEEQIEQEVIKQQKEKEQSIKRELVFNQSIGSDDVDQIDDDSKTKDEIDKNGVEKDNAQEEQSGAIHKHKWYSKVARYLAYTVDGGILCSQFTLHQLVNMLASVSDPNDEKEIQDEIAYLLHIRKVGKEYERSYENTIDKQLRDIALNFNSYAMNQRVLVVLIESGYVLQILKSQSKTLYLRLLETIIRESDKNFMKEACCKMIIKYFGKENEQELKMINYGNDEDKFDFSSFMDPIVQIMARSFEYGSKLTSLSIMTMVNMCNFQDFIKHILIDKNGSYIINELLESKDEEILLNNLRLIMSLISVQKDSKQESKIGQMLVRENEGHIIHKIIQIIKQGPSIRYCNFNNQIYFMCISLLRAFISIPEVVKIIMNDIDNMKIILNDKEKLKSDKEKTRRYPLDVINKLNNMMSIEEINNYDDNIQGAILSLFLQIVQNENDYKKIIGQIFSEKALIRLQQILLYKYLKQKKLEGMQYIQEILENEEQPDKILLDEKNEKKFFQLLNISLKSKDKDIKEIFFKFYDELKAYEEEIHERIQHYQDKNKDNDEVYENILKVKDKLKHILIDLSSNQE